MPRPSVPPTTATDGTVVERTIRVDGVERRYLLYLPSGLDPARPAPLVLNLHGLSSTAERQLAQTGFNETAEAHGVVVAYPQALAPGTVLGVPISQWDIALDTGVDDIGFFSALIDDVAARHLIDDGRVYVTGMSFGSVMAFTTACALAEEITAVASVSGGLAVDLRDRCRPSRPVPLLHIHGLADLVVPTTGIPGVTLGPEESVEFLADTFGCDPEPRVEPLPDVDPSDGTTVTRRAYGGCRSGASVEYYEIAGGGHTWPGAADMPIFGETSRDIDASELIWSFFDRYTR